MRGPGADRLLQRALLASAAAAGTTIEVDACRSDAWRSATFSGARHVLEASGPYSPPLETWLAELPASDLPLGRHLLAELAVVSRTAAAGRLRFRIDALTVAEE